MKNLPAPFQAPTPLDLTEKYVLQGYVRVTDEKLIGTANPEVTLRHSFHSSSTGDWTHKQQKLFNFFFIGILVSEQRMPWYFLLLLLLNQWKNSTWEVMALEVVTE